MKAELERFGRSEIWKLELMLGLSPVGNGESWEGLCCSLWPLIYVSGTIFNCFTSVRLVSQETYNLMPFHVPLSMR